MKICLDWPQSLQKIVKISCSRLSASWVYGAGLHIYIDHSMCDVANILQTAFTSEDLAIVISLGLQSLATQILFKTSGLMGK